jgi:hypothetical protein
MRHEDAVQLASDARCARHLAEPDVAGRSLLVPEPQAISDVQAERLRPVQMSERWGRNFNMKRLWRFRNAERASLFIDAL